MAKIAFFVSHPEMLAQAKAAAQLEHIEDVDIRLIETANSVEEARKAIQNGACILVARGRQASLIKQQIDIPVVEITLTGQEIARLISQAKKMLSKPHPTIAFIGFANIFCNMDYFEEIFDIRLLTYFVQTAQEVNYAIEQVIEQGADLIIGGDAACSCARRHHFPNLFLSSTEDSAREAFRVVRSALYMHDMEQIHTAQFQALLDYSFNGILRIDTGGNIVVCNHIAEEILGKKQETLVGLPLSSVLPSLNQAILELLQSGKELYSEFITVNQTALIANLVPIQVEGHIDGAILSFHEIQKLKSMEASVRLELYRNNRRAKYEFERLTARSPAMKRTIVAAKVYAQTELPLFVCGEQGTEREGLAQSIHNAGNLKNQPFVSIDCAAIPQEEQRNTLFGCLAPEQKGAIDFARDGTLFLDHIASLTSCCQHLLLRLLRDGVLQLSDSARLTPVKIRLIAADTEPLTSLITDNSFCEELYHILGPLCLQIPPLRQRPEDLEWCLAETIREISSRYYRYVSLTKSAKKRLLNYRWPGNFLQLQKFCERMVLTASHRTIDEGFVENLLSSLYPTCASPVGKSTVIYKNPEAAEIIRLLKKYHGNRDLTAQELNISKTTLWRHMKKYGIIPQFEAEK